MKRLLGILIALVLVGMLAAPASAQGPRRDDHLCFGGTTVVSATETVQSVLMFACGGRISSGAHVTKDVVSFGGDVIVEGGATIDHDLIVFGGNVTIEPEAVIEHDVVLFGGQSNIKPGAIVRGQTIFGTGFAGWRGWAVGPQLSGANGLSLVTNAIFDLIRSLVTALALAVLGALTVIFLPKQTKQVGDTAQTAALPSLGVGCLTLIVWFSLFLLLVFASVILVITIIGIPLAVILLVVPPVALAVVWLFGWIAVGRLVGEKVLEAFKAREILPVVAVVIGVILLALLGAVPVIGGLVSLFLGLLAVGAVVLTRFGTQPYPPSTIVGGPVVPVAPPSPPPKAPAVPPTPPAPPAEPAQML